MANLKPLVIVLGQIEQLQTGDVLDHYLTDGSVIAPSQIDWTSLGVGVIKKANIDWVGVDEATLSSVNWNFVHLSGNETVAGVKYFSSYPTGPTSFPTTDYQLVTKAYVDNVAVGLSWKSAVLGIQTTPPITPSVGDRYVVLPTGIGLWATHDNAIAVWNGVTWDFTTPSIGWALLNLGDNTGYVYTASGWVAFTPVQVYTASNGVKKVFNDFRIDFTTMGVIPIANLATGTPTGSKFVRDDGTLAVPAIITTKTIGVNIDGGASPISLGTKGYYRVDFAGTILSWTILEISETPITGSCIIDVWKVATGTYPPTLSNTITNGHSPALASGIFATQNNLSNWTSVAVSVGDTLGYHVDSASTVKKILLQLVIQATS